MKNHRYSRRALLQTLGVGAGMLPLLHAEASLAQTTGSGFPTRLITITWTNGIVPSAFYPPAGPLTAALPAILSPLETWKSKVLALRGARGTTSPIDSQVMIDAAQTYGGHIAYPSLFTGTYKGTAPSIDQLIADSLVAQGVNSPQLTLGARPGASSTSWKASGQKNSAEVDPFRLFSKLFAGASLSTDQLASLRLRRKSVLDFALGELNAYSGRVGTDDKLKIQAHMDSIRALEADLESATTAGCAPPTMPATAPNFKQVTNYPILVDLMMKLSGAAIKCGMARVITLDLIDDGGGNSLTFPWLNIPSPDYHAIAHQGASGYANKTVIDTWFYKQVATLVADLAGATEAGGSALDNSVIVVTNDMSGGETHFVGSLPYLLIGSCAGFFKTGQTVMLPKQVPNNQLLTTLCHAMGLNIASVGDKYTGDIDASLKA